MKSAPKALATIWIVWLGSRPMPLLHKAAVDSCRRAAAGREGAFIHRLITDADLRNAPSRLGFALHDGFVLLDLVQQSDYLRAELLYHHGGFYLDADIFCLHSLGRAYNMSHGYEASGASAEPKHNIPTELVLENNALGPFKKHSAYAHAWHIALHEKMKLEMPKLANCLATYPNGHGGVKYPEQLICGQNQCGFEWGAFIDINKHGAWSLNQRGYFGKALKLCHLEKWKPEQYCDVVHAGAASETIARISNLSVTDLCRLFPVLRRSRRICAREQHVKASDFLSLSFHNGESQGTTA